MIRVMTIEDYDEVFTLWNSIQGFAIRSIDDSREGVARFLRRNPTTSCVYIKDEKIVGAILCGHDGRQGSFYHVCVDKDYRRHHIGHKMVDFCIEALKKEYISKVSLNAFVINEAGNAFWTKMGWKIREDLNEYDYIINMNNRNVVIGDKEIGKERNAS